MQLKRHTCRRERLCKAQTVDHGDGLVRRRVPQERGRHPGPHEALAGELPFLLGRQRKMPAQMLKAARVRLARLGRDHRVTQQHRIHIAARGKMRAHGRAVKRRRIVRGQVPACRKAEQRQPLRIAVPCIGARTDQLHRRRYLAELRREAVRVHRIVQHKHVVPRGEEMQRHGLALPLADKLIAAAGTDQERLALLPLAVHLGHVVRPIAVQHRVPPVFAEKRINILQMQGLTLHGLYLLYLRAMRFFLL